MAYTYVYASSRYPFVPNAVTGNGELFPRSNPSPASAAHQAGGANKKFVVTLTKTTRSDVDKIWIYRTAVFTTSAEATNAASAGTMFYVGTVGNDGISGTTTFTDDNVSDTSEPLELDNYPAPTTQLCEFDGTYWWAIGNFSLDAVVTIDGTASIIASTQWFNGRNGQTATFDGITTGGLDGRGTFYWKWTGPTTAMMYSNAALTNTITVNATGTTKIHIRGPGTTLYRSKPLNPFSWGTTDIEFDPSDETNEIPVPRLFAESFGSGQCAAMSLVGDDSYLILHLEEPTRTLRLSLSEADTPDFRATEKPIDTQSSIGSHFSQFHARTTNGNTTLVGIDTKNVAIMSTDGEQQIPISSNVFDTLRSIQDSETASRFFHGIYDARTELNCWFIKTLELDDNLIDTLVYQHSPTGEWGTATAFEVSASATVYDPTTKETFTLIGDENGRIGILFDDDTRTHFMNSVGTFSAASVIPSSVDTPGIDFTLPLVPTSDSSDSGATGEIFFFDIAHGFSVGDWVLLLSDVTSAGTDELYEIISVADAFTIELDRPFSPIALANYWFLPPIKGYWAYIQNTSTGENGTWLRLSGLNDDGQVQANGTTPTSVQVDGYGYDMVLIDGHVTATSGTLPSGLTASATTVYFGLIPCDVRRYFDVDQPTRSKRVIESWATMQSVTDHHCHVYEEFDDAIIAGNSYKLLQGVKPRASSASTTWLKKTDIPASLLTAFGFGISERGAQDFRLLNYTLKLESDPAEQ